MNDLFILNPRMKLIVPLPSIQVKALIADGKRLKADTPESYCRCVNQSIPSIHVHIHIFTYTP